MRDMKFVLLYKGNVLSVQGCTRFLIGFVWFLNNLSLTLRRLLIVLFFYQTNSLRHSLQKLTLIIDTYEGYEFCVIVQGYYINCTWEMC